MCDGRALNYGQELDLLPTELDQGRHPPGAQELLAYGATADLDDELGFRPTIKPGGSRTAMSLLILRQGHLRM